MERNEILLVEKTTQLLTAAEKADTFSEEMELLLAAYVLASDNHICPEQTSALHDIFTPGSASMKQWKQEMIQDTQAYWDSLDGAEMSDEEFELIVLNKIAEARKKEQ